MFNSTLSVDLLSSFCSSDKENAHTPRGDRSVCWMVKCTWFWPTFETSPFPYLEVKSHPNNNSHHSCSRPGNFDSQAQEEKLWETLRNSVVVSSVKKERLVAIGASYFRSHTKNKNPSWSCPTWVRFFFPTESSSLQCEPWTLAKALC